MPRQTGLALELREIESTESVPLDHGPEGMDDFGTGFSSLSDLTEVPFDTVKIDRSLVRGRQNRPEKVAVVRRSPAWHAPCRCM